MSVVGTGPGVRATAPFVAVPLDVPAFPPVPPALLGQGSTLAEVPPYVPVHDAVVTLESSAAWPDTAEAVAHALAAWYLKLGAVLAEATGALCQATPSWLDVLWAGHVFRLRIWHERLLPVLAAAPPIPVRTLDVSQVQAVRAHEKQ